MNKQLGAYAECGVEYISSGALTHSVGSGARERA
jgi:nicotinate-nucleotide pyrophosphorylase